MGQLSFLRRGYCKPQQQIFVRSRVSCGCNRSQSRVIASYDKTDNIRRSIAALLITVATAGQLYLALPSTAIETVSADTAVQTAKAIPVQQFDKGKIWLLLVGGAASLLFATIQVENVEMFFPAISSANKAMDTYRDREKERAQQVQKMVKEEKQMQRIDAAVEAGMRQAREKQQQKQQLQQQQEMPAQLNIENQNVAGSKTSNQDDSDSKQINELEEELEKRRQQQQEVS
eukprot:TRINITY_DN3122_c0_g1_i2.p1 TRINITY_DN3122_c0_g1~~TRINITY_DN3122_c0_g1_i2.p1  ORF type:complete len:231 (+),score=36.89 TRINITY_DN3122_c0_g1_i2:77-769(+)